MLAGWLVLHGISAMIVAYFFYSMYLDYTGWVSYCDLLANSSAGYNCVDVLNSYNAA